MRDSKTDSLFSRLTNTLSPYIPNIVLSMGLLLTLAIVRIDYQRIENDAETLTRERLYGLKSRIEQAFNERLGPAYSLEAFVKMHLQMSLQDPEQEAQFKRDFVQLTNALTARTKGLLSIQLAPQAVVSYLTNEERNKAAIGHDLLLDPNRRSQTLRTIQARKIIVAGPLQLKQGGDAFIARLAIFTQPGNFDAKHYMRQRDIPDAADWIGEVPDDFWGLATVLIDVPTMYQAAALDSLQNGTRFALRGRHGLGAQGDVFFGDEHIFDIATASVSVLLPDGEWIIAAHTPTELDGLFYLNLILSLAITLTLYKLMKVQQLHIEVRAASDIKDAVLANISHELRTPLNGIVGLSEALKTSPLSRDEAEQIELIQRNALNMTHTVNDVVNMVEIDNGNLILTNEPFELRTELASIGRDMESQARAHSAQMNCPITNFDSLNIVTDREKLRQILTRLIDNAIRFSDGGQIEVEAKEVASISDTARIRFVVRDDGPGISQEKQQLLFKAFIQNDLSDTRRHSGLGIGLSISQRIIEKMGGTLDVDSDEGNGATFHFTLDLPRAQAAEAAGDILPPDAPASRDTAQTLRAALVVDDNPINSMVIVNAMKRFGFETETALNGEQAVEKALKTDYELIIMDCQMPIMDGYEATEQIREREKAAGTEQNPSVIIACTANGLESNRTKCIQAGMNDFLVKPIQRAHMEEALRKHGLLHS